MNTSTASAPTTQSPAAPPPHISAAVPCGCRTDGVSVIAQSGSREMIGPDMAAASEPDPVTGTDQNGDLADCENANMFHEKLLPDTMRAGAAMDSRKAEVGAEALA